ncbi:Hint domain-containing protein [Phaeovulum sp. W22_SRMD_FR3]|uniref:Hint domain-containing protein n=1 Tax=Phaeovulum sp. W22_SRMD_FR3 TaxID=3240274 RepID=UPI003F99C7FD
MVTRSLDDVYAYSGSLVSLSNTKLLSSFSGPQSGALTVEDADLGKDWDHGEVAGYQGSSATLVGSGTATVGVSVSIPFLINVTVDAGSPVAVNAFQTAEDTYFHYPAGQPASLLDGLVSDLQAAVLAALPVGISLSTVLGLLGVPDLETYVQQNAVLVFDISAGAPILLCFAAGTLIETARGPRAVEELRVGDLVQTLDHGLQPLSWVGARRVPARGEMAPVHFSQGALGNRRGLTVSPQHRMLIRSPRAELLFGEHEVLVAAKHLVNGQTIYRREGGFVDYVHLLFRQHEIVFSEGVPSESFHPAERSLASFAPDTRAEIAKLFPELARLGKQGIPSARPTLKAYEAALLDA